MNFPASKITEHMQKAKTKVMVVSKQNLLKFKTWLMEGKKKKKKIKKITEFNYLIDVDKAKGRKDGRAQHLRTHNGSRVDTYWAGIRNNL